MVQVFLVTNCISWISVTYNLRILLLLQISFNVAGFPATPNVTSSTADSLDTIPGIDKFNTLDKLFQSSAKHLCSDFIIISNRTNHAPRQDVNYSQGVVSLVHYSFTTQGNPNNKNKDNKCRKSVNKEQLCRWSSSKNPRGRESKWKQAQEQRTNKHTLQ